MAKTLIYGGEPATLMLTRYSEKCGSGLCISVINKKREVIDNLTWNLFPNPFAELGEDEVIIEKYDEPLFEQYGFGEFKDSISQGPYVYYIMKLDIGKMMEYVSVDRRENPSKGEK